MNTEPIEYVEAVKGYKLNKNELGCEYFDNCFECKRRECKFQALDERRKKQLNSASARYYQRHKEEVKEKNRRWREKRKLIKLLEQQREQAEKENENDNISEEIK